MDWDSYFMALAHTTSVKSSCSKRKVGAVIVRDRRVIAAGFNGTPTKYLNCDRGGCPRCSDPEKYPSGIGYSDCTCLHAEHNAILMAAKYSGLGVQDGVLYSTLAPCLNCLAFCVQVGIETVWYDEPFLPNKSISKYYYKLVSLLPGGLKSLTEMGVA